MLSVGCACKACVECYEFMPRLKSHPQAPSVCLCRYFKTWERPRSKSRWPQPTIWNKEHGAYCLTIWFGRWSYILSPLTCIQKSAEWLYLSRALCFSHSQTVCKTLAVASLPMQKSSGLGTGFQILPLDNVLATSKGYGDCWWLLWAVIFGFRCALTSMLKGLSCRNRLLGKQAWPRLLHRLPSVWVIWICPGLEGSPTIRLDFRNATRAPSAARKHWCPLWCRRHGDM